MKAAVYRKFGGPVRIENVPRPRCPKDGLLVQVMATGVCRSDWHGWKGHDSDIVAHGLPFVPGHEFSGVVVETGPLVKKIGNGDRVIAPFILSCGCCHNCAVRGRPTVCRNQEQPGFTYWGSFAEYVTIPRADRNVRKIPKRVSHVQAAALGCRFTTAYRAVFEQGNLQPESTLAVFGCGGVGLSCIMLAAARHPGECKIIAVDVSRNALEKARSLGATHTVLAPRPSVSTDGDNDDADAIRRQVRALCNGEGADLSIDAAGFAQTCENAVHCTRAAGRMVQVGLPIGRVPPQVPMGLVAAREIEIYGSHGFSVESLVDLLQMVETGALNLSVLVEREVTLQEGVRALEEMDGGSPVGITMITSFDDRSRL